MDDRKRDPLASPECAGEHVTRPPRLMVEARRILLDALEALAVHRRSLVLVGAQGVYLRTNEVDLSFSASYTTDADLVIDPTTLAATPLLAYLMTAAVSSGSSLIVQESGESASPSADTPSSYPSISSSPRHSLGPDGVALGSPGMANKRRAERWVSKRPS